MPNPFDPNDPWYMGGGGSGGPLGGGAFPAAPAANPVMPPWTAQMQASPMNQILEGPMATPAMAQPAQQGPGFNAMMDPSRGGLYSTLGAMLGYPTRAENQKAQMGQARTAGLQKLGELSQQLGPQKGILEFIKTPEGAAFVANSTDPAGEMKAYLGITSTDPSMAGRGAAFAGDPAQGGAAGADPMAGLEPGKSASDYLAIAEERAAAGDDEGAKLALQMSEEARLAGTAAQEAITTDDIKEYRAYVQQEEENGRIPESLKDWIRTNIKSGVQTSAGLPIAPALVDAALKYEASAANADTQMAEAEQMRSLALSTDTGWLQSMTLSMRAALQSIGVNITPETDLADQQVLQALSNQMALRLRNPESGFGLTGNTSNFDLLFLKGSVAGLDKLPETNQIVLLVLGGRMRRQALLDRAKAEWISDTGKLPVGKEWNELQKELIEETPLLLPEEKEFINQIREDNGMARIIGQNPETGLPIMGPEPVPQVGAPGAPDANRWGEAPKTFLPDAGNLRQRAWEIYNEDKAKATPDAAKPDAAPKANRLKKEQK